MQPHPQAKKYCKIDLLTTTLLHLHFRVFVYDFGFQGLGGGLCLGSPVLWYAAWRPGDEKLKLSAATRLALAVKSRRLLQWRLLHSSSGLPQVNRRIALEGQ